MKNVLLISDSHGNKKGVEKLLSENNFDLILFTGDGLKDVENVNTNIVKVAGNCDLFSQEPLEEIVCVEGLNILLTHGHLYKAKYTLLPLAAQAQKRNCTVVCFGHTHQKTQENLNGLLLLNAGALKNGNALCFTINNGEISNLNFLNIYN